MIEISSSLQNRWPSRIESRNHFRSKVIQLTFQELSQLKPKCAIALNFDNLFGLSPNCARRDGIKLAA